MLSFSYQHADCELIYGHVVYIMHGVANGLYSYIIIRGACMFGPINIHSY